MAPQPRYNAVDSNLTLSPGQTWTSYQYKLSNVEFGICVNNPAMMSGDTYMAIQKADSVGGTRTNVGSMTISPSTIQESAGINYTVRSTTYMNGQFKNVGSASSTFRIGIGWD